MKLIGLLGNNLIHYIEGARLIVQSTLSPYELNSVECYANIPKYSSMYYVNIAIYGEQAILFPEYHKTEVITEDDRKVYGCYIKGE